MVGIFFSSCLLSLASILIDHVTFRGLKWFRGIGKPHFMPLWCYAIFIVVFYSFPLHNKNEAFKEPQSFIPHYGKPWSSLRSFNGDLFRGHRLCLPEDHEKLKNEGLHSVTQLCVLVQVAFTPQKMGGKKERKEIWLIHSILSSEIRKSRRYT